jgi:2,4-dienoyl-CoA reductase-like NADH-dependent reductase (Old Yellow Enzyme family)
MPLLVRISAVDYLDTPEAWTMEDSLKLSGMLAENGVDFITASGGGFAHVDKSLVHPGYQLPFATAIKGQTGILTGTVGMITNAEQANQIIVDGEAHELNLETDIPWQYKRGY